MTGRMTVRTVRMKWTVQNLVKAAITSVTIRLVAFQKPLFVMVKKTVLMGQMKINAVGEFWLSSIVTNSTSVEISY